MSVCVSKEASMCLKMSIPIITFQSKTLYNVEIFHLQGIVCYASHDCPDKTVCKCKVGFGCESLKGTNDDNSDVSSSNDDTNGSAREIAILLTH